MPTNPLLAITAAQLRQAAEIREKIDDLERELDQILGVEPLELAASSPRRRKRRRKLSRAARARLSAAAKARWAKVKARGGKSL